MALRIPSDASRNIQQAFRDLDEKLDRVGSSSSVDKEMIKRLIREEIANSQTTNITTVLPPSADIMRPSGPGHMYGYAPDPGRATTFASSTPGAANDQTGTDSVLHEDAKWKWPLSGRLVETTIPTDPIDSFNILGGLSVLGPLQSSIVFTDGIINNGMDAAYIGMSGTQTIANNTSTLLSFDTPTFNYGGVYSASAPTILTFRYPGLVLLGTSIRWTASATAGIRGAAVSLQGASIAITSQRYNSADGTNQIRSDVTGLTLAKAGETFNAQAFQTTGGNLDVAASSFFWGVQLARMA